MSLNTNPTAGGGNMAQFLADPNGPVRLFLAMLYNLASLLTAPAESGMRNEFGTQYFNGFVLPVAVLWFQFVAVAMVVLTYTMNRPRAELITSGVILLCFWAGLLYHGFRITRLVNNTDLEKNSRDDGPGLSFMPGKTWARQRIVWEPLFVLSVALVLCLLGLLNPLFCLYFSLVAVALSVKGWCAWWSVWTYVRDILDQSAEAPKLAALLRAGPKSPPMTPSKFMSLPASTSQQERVVLAAQIIGLSPEMKAMLSKPEPSQSSLTPERHDQLQSNP